MALPAVTPAAGVQRIAFVCPPGAPLQQLRDMLFGEVIARNNSVLVVAPEFSSEDVRALDELGVEHDVFTPDGYGPKLFADWKAIGTLKQTLSDWEPDLVVAYGAKIMVYGALAAKSADPERIVLIVDGLPEHRFSGALGADEMPAWRYGQALRTADEAVFHNRDDLALLKKLGVVPDALPVAVVPGAGVDLDSQSVLPLPALGHGLVFLMIASLERRRGVLEYCAAATAVRQRAPSSRFLLASLPAEGAAAVTCAELAQFADVEYLGAAADHPSRVGGVPRLRLSLVRRRHAAAGAAGDGRRAPDPDNQHSRLPRHGRRARQRLPRCAARRRGARRGHGELSQTPRSHPGDGTCQPCQGGALLHCGLGEAVDDGRAADRLKCVACWRGVSG